MTTVGQASLEERPQMVGAYLRATAAPAITGVPASELTDQIIPLEHLWGPSAHTVIASLCESRSETARVELLESALLHRIGHSTQPHNPPLRIKQIAHSILERRGQTTVDSLAAEAGVSRQYLSFRFRESVGVTPKQFCRLARFHSALQCLSDGEDAASVAVGAGYADQSHMIAEFRTFSSLTPHRIVTEDWFHPFTRRS